MKSLLSTREYLKIKDWYWICAFSRHRSKHSLKIIFSKDKPKPVPNPNMDWFTPTFEELCLYNQYWTSNDD